MDEDHSVKMLMNDLEAMEGLKSMVHKISDDMVTVLDALYCNGYPKETIKASVLVVFETMIDAGIAAMIEAERDE